MRIKKGDQVTVNTGKDKGKEGEVIMISGDKAVVKGVNMSKKHQKQDQKNEGGFINKEMPITLSNLMLLDKKTKKGTRQKNKKQTPCWFKLFCSGYLWAGSDGRVHRKTPGSCYRVEGLPPNC